MINTLYLPELREMLTEGDAEGLREFCTALHPARTAEFMEGLDADEIWRVLQYADPDVREEIFSFLPEHKQVELLETQDRDQVAALLADVAPDDRVDLLEETDERVVSELLPLLPADERRDYLRLREYPEDSAGSIMTTEVAKLDESLTVKDALDELRRQAEELETIYYIYVVDDTNHLRGVVSARQLLSAMTRPDTRLGELMETDVVCANVLDDQEEVARKVARFDLLAIPVVDDEHRMLGIVTHDDVLDVLREEATEDAHRIAGVDPLDEGYMQTNVFTLSWKRGIWLSILFATELLTAFALRHYQDGINKFTWLVFFIPLVIASGGSSGNQSAALIIRALATHDVELGQWFRVVRRELIQGLLLGCFLGMFGFVLGFVLTDRVVYSLVITVTLVLVVISGTFFGSLLPLVFKRLGLDPALMSNPFVAGLCDVVGIVIYINVALILTSLVGDIAP